MARAVRFNSYGDRDVLYVAEVEVPEPPRGEVVVEVHAAGINPGEAKIRSGANAGRSPATFPSGQGSDLAGVVSAIGEGVTEFALGDEVLGWSWRRSSQAEFVVVPADQLIPKPPQLSWEVAGSLYVAGATAYAAVRAVRAQSGDTVAVSAAAGGVGSVVVQLLRVNDANVLGIASERHHDWLASKGVVPIRYGDGLADRLRAAAPAGIDAFIDTVGTEYVDLALELGVAPQRIDTIVAFGRAAEVGAKAEGSVAGTSREALAELAELAASGRLEIPIAATYRLDEVRAAYAALEQGHTQGKIVLVP
jgi:NADPH:quinone reductase